MAAVGPQRPRQHVIGEIAERAFEGALAPAWVPNKLYRDYGLDFMVTLTQADTVSPLSFFAQVKGSESVQYLANGTDLSFPVEVATLQLLVRQQTPVLLAVCDVSKPENPVYWVWVSNAVRDVELVNPTWANQESLTVRVPLANRLGLETHARIEAEVRTLYDTFTMGIALLRMVAPPAALLQLPRRDPTASIGNELRNVVISSVERSGLGELVSMDGGTELEPFSESDQRVWATLNEVKTLLNAFRDTLATAKLDSLREDIESSAVSLVARYWNAGGILSIRGDQHSAAVEAFTRAAALRPTDRKYSTNLLAAEFNAAWDPTTRNRTPPDDWDARLESILTQQPDHVAIRLRALRLVKTHGGPAAREFVRSSGLWAKDRNEGLVLCAEVSRLSGEIDEGLRCLAEVRDPEPRLEPELSLTRAELLFLLATRGPNGVEGDRTIHGYGPAEMDETALSESAEAFTSAYRVLRDHEFPRSGEEIVRGTAMVLMLLGRTEESENVCRAYLERQPGAHEIHGALAMALAYQGDLGDAIPHAKRAVEGDPRSAQAYINLLAVLHLAEDYRGVLQACGKRQEEGFRSEEERKVPHEFAAIAYTQRREFGLAEEQIRALGSLPDGEPRAVVAESLLSKARGVGKSEPLRYLRAGLTTHPASALVLTALAHELLPVTSDSAEELISLFERVGRLRQLAPEEVGAYGRALSVVNRVREATRVFERGCRRYPAEAQFLFDLALALRKLGDPDGAYEAMAKYLTVGKRDETVYRALGYLARDTERLDEAIEMFQTALGRASKDEERGEIHRQLWELRRRRGDAPKAILEHAMGYGRTTGGAPEAEARFLMLCVLSPAASEADDLEVASWAEEIRARMAAFGQEHPRFAGFQAIRIPEGLTEEQQRRHLFSELASISLPGHLLRTQFELLIRGDAWPLATRSMFLKGGQSLFEYWESCQESDDYAHGLHIHEGHVGIDEESHSVPLRAEVCVDLSALLTLSTLSLLDELLGVFVAVFIPRGALRAIQEEFGGVDPPHGEAQKLLTWIRGNRRAVHVQAADGVADRERPDETYGRMGSMWVAQEPNLASLVGGGTGESVLLARQLGLPLYCDEATIRRWPREDYGVTGFSTLALLTALRKTGRVTPTSEARCLVRLIARNYRRIPVTAGHLHARLMEVLDKRGGAGTALTADTLDEDEILGPLLRQLGSRDLVESTVYQVAAMWWVELLSSEVPDETIRSLVRRMSFTLAQRTDRPDAVLVGIWAAFILKADAVSRDLARRAWSVVVGCAEDLMPQNEPRARRLVQERLPEELYQLIQRIPGWEQGRKDEAVIALGGVLPNGAYQRILALIAQSARRGR